MQVVVSQLVAIGQLPMGQPPHGIMLEIAGSPTLMLGQQIACSIVFKGEWPGAIIHLGQLTVLVIAELDFTAIGQGFFKQPSHGVPLITGDQLGLLLAELYLLAQVTIEIVAVSGGAAIKAGFPRDQAIGEIVNAVLFAMLVLNLAQEELGIVVAIRELTAIGVDSAAHQMQASSSHSAVTLP
jgi:hypothetical protein